MKIMRCLVIALAALSMLFAAVSCDKDGAAVPGGQIDSGGRDDEDDGGPLPVTFRGSDRPLLLAEQSQSMAVIMDADKNTELWAWRLASSGIPSGKQKYFKNIDEVKPVYNREYIILTASSGGVAMVRVADRKLMFWACPGGNPHSAEVLPDGHLVVATSEGSSTAHNSLLVYRVDSLRPESTGYVWKTGLDFGHNVVWDLERERLYATERDKLNVYTYTNIDGRSPRLVLEKQVALPGTGAHELFPEYGQDRLWLSTSKDVYRFFIGLGSFVKPSFSKGSVKSVSSGPEGFPVVMLTPTESYWSHKVVDSDGKEVVSITDGKIYKARWFIDNPFSYPRKHKYLQPE